MSPQSCPPITISYQLAEALVDGPSPAFAIGICEEGGEQSGLMAIRVDEDLPEGLGIHAPMRIGHSLVASTRTDVPLPYFNFSFPGFRDFDVILKPDDPVVRKVLGMIVVTQRYFMLVIGRNHSATAFGGEATPSNFVGLADNLPRLLVANLTEADYQRALSSETQLSRTPVQRMHWVARGAQSPMKLLGKDRLTLESR